MPTITALSETGICNMALGRIGAKRINGIGDTSEDSVEAIQCRLHYSQTRDALIRSHWWRMARDRATLSQNAAYTADDNTFEWTYAYDLPVDFLRMKLPFENIGAGAKTLVYTYSIEGTQLLSNDSTMKIQYIKKVTDPPSFDPLFVEVFILTLALKIIYPLAGAGRVNIILARELKDELYGTPKQPGLIAQVQAIDKEETNTTGMVDVLTWNQAMLSGTGNSAKRDGFFY